MICLKLATRTGSFQVEVDATPADCGVSNITYERKPLTVPGTRNTGTNYADSRNQLSQIDNPDRARAFAIPLHPRSLPCAPAPHPNAPSPSDGSAVCNYSRPQDDRAHCLLLTTMGWAMNRGRFRQNMRGRFWRKSRTSCREFLKIAPNQTSPSNLFDQISREL